MAFGFYSLLHGLAGSYSGPGVPKTWRLRMVIQQPSRNKKLKYGNCMEEDIQARRLNAFCRDQILFNKKQVALQWRVQSSRRKSMRIRFFLLIMALLILVPITASSIVALNLLQRAELKAALRGLHESVNGLALLVEGELSSTEAGLLALASSPSLSNGDFQAFHGQAKRFNRGPEAWTVLSDHESRQIVNTLRPYGSPLPPPGEQDLARKIISANKTWVSHVRPGPVSGKMVTTLTVPVTLGNGEKYLLSEVFATDHFKQLIGTFRVPDGWLFAVIDQDGNFVARNLNDDKLIGKPARAELVAAARQTGTGYIRHQTIEGIEVYDAFARTSLSGWTVAIAAPVDLIESSARQATKVAGLGILAAILFAGTSVFLLGGRHVRDIQRAAKASMELGLGKVSTPFNSPVAEVNNLYAAIHNAGQELLQAEEYRRATELERQSLLQREQSARQLAEEQNKAKDQFLAMLGHELRNPLAPIANAAELLQRPGTSSERVQHVSTIISRQVMHMTSLLEDLLDVSRVTRGLIKLHPAPLDMATVVANAVEQVRPLIESKGHQLVLHTPSEHVLVNGDRIRLVQAAANLLTNAAKYTESGGKIDLHLQSEGNWVMLTVRDNGMGISADLLPRVFDLFSQGERTLGRSQGGLGLGLTLVRKLVELHGGYVTAESAGEGKGSTFTVWLPRIDMAGTLEEVDEVKAASTQKTLKVLVVDDNADAAQTLAMLLREANGYDVTVCQDGSSALKIVETHEIDAVILDIGLPDIDGYEVARRMRQMKYGADALLLALTGYGQSKDVELAKVAGFNYHLSKPASPKAIVDLLMLHPRMSQPSKVGSMET
jgi:signal transduction histidine kinase/ActR/RegA family two-component response regulator